MWDLNSKKVSSICNLHSLDVAHTNSSLRARTTSPPFHIWLPAPHTVSITKSLSMHSLNKWKKYKNYGYKVYCGTMRHVYVTLFKRKITIYHSNYRLLNTLKGIKRKRKLSILSHVLFWPTEFEDILNTYWSNVLIFQTKNDA